MEYRFNRDADSGLAHCEQHDVSEREAIEVLQHPAERFRRKDGVLVAHGQTAAGRYLRIIYREYAREGYRFIITAYDLTGNPKKAFRRRRKRQ